MLFYKLLNIVSAISSFFLLLSFTHSPKTQCLLFIGNCIMGNKYVVNVVLVHKMLKS